MVTQSSSFLLWRVDSFFIQKVPCLFYNEGLINQISNEVPKIKKVREDVTEIIFKVRELVDEVKAFDTSVTEIDERIKCIISSGEQKFIF